MYSKRLPYVSSLRGFSLCKRGCGPAFEVSPRISISYSGIMNRILSVVTPAKPEQAPMDIKIVARTAENICPQRF